MGKMIKVEKAHWATKRITEKTKLSVLLSIIAFAVYANTLRNGFAYDDLSVITKNTIVTKGISAIPEILTTPYRRGFFITSNDTYRPLSQVMFAIEYQVFDGNPSAMHFFNILFFVGCVILFFYFLDALFDGQKTTVAFIASLLFALHPIHTEVVANIKSRDELMCFFFSFLSLNLFIKYARNGKGYLYLIATLSFLLSLFSKETILSFTAIAMLVFFFYKKEHIKRSIFIVAGCLGVTIVFLFVRFYVLMMYNANHISDLQFIDNQLSQAPSAMSRAATAILVLGKYLKLLFFPYPLISDYAYNTIPFVHLSNVWVLLSVCGYIALIVIGIYRLVKFKKDPYAFGILFYIITIAIFSNLFILTGAIMGERFLFFPSVGFCLLAALFMQRITREADRLTNLKNRGLVAVLILVSVVYAVITYNRNKDWYDSITLYKADVKNAPRNARLYYAIGNELLIAGTDKDPDSRVQMTNEAIDSAKRAIVIYPSYKEAYEIIGKGYFVLSQFDSAVFYLKQVLQFAPGNTEALNSLNVIYFTSGKYSDAINVCEKIIKKDSLFIEGYNDAAICYLHLNEVDSAVFFLNRAMSIAPDSTRTYANLALAYKIKGDTTSAKKYEAIANRYYPGFHVY